MTFWTDPFVDDSATSFIPLFCLLDDFDTYTREASGGDSGRRQRRHKGRGFSPRFDVRELPDGYELYGELPGIDHKDVEIEFTDAQTLVVRGHIERAYTPPGQQDESQKTEGAGTEEESEAKKSTTQGTDQDQNKQVQKKPQDQAKYLTSERRVGEFSRTFNFPERVDQDGVKASMKNGILNIWVPKAKKSESRKIQVSC